MRKHSLSGEGLSVVLEGDRLRAARVEFGSAKLGAVRELALPRGTVEDGMIYRLDAVREALARLLLDDAFQKLHRVVFSVCSTQVISEDVSVPPVGERKLARLLAANTDVYFPVDVSDCRLTWARLGRTVGVDGREEQCVRLWAAPNALLQRYYAVANDCGLSVAAIDFAGNSLASLAAVRARAETHGEQHGAYIHKILHENAKPTASVALATPEETSDELYLLLESEHLMMTFLHAGKVRMQRLLLRGMDGDELREARLALEYYTSQPQSALRVALTVCGSLARDAEEVRRAEQALDLEAAVGEEPIGGAWCLCAGAALATHDLGSASLDRRPHRSLAQQARQYAALFVCALVLVSVLVMDLGARLVWDATLTGLRQNRETLQVQLKASAGNAEAFRAYATLYEDYSTDWDVVFHSTRMYNDALPLLLEELETTLPRSVRVVTAAVGEDGLGLQFACPTKEEAARLILALRELDYAALAQLSDLTADPAEATGEAMLSYLNSPENGAFQPAARGNTTGDTLYLAAALRYRDSLLTAPLARDGLAQDDKLERLEVRP